MSVQTEITRLENAKTAIVDAIAGKGVTVPDGTMLDGLAALIESIEAGGGGSVIAVTDDGDGNIELNELYSFGFTDDGNGNLTCIIVPSTTSIDNSGDITIT